MAVPKANLFKNPLRHRSFRSIWQCVNLLLDKPDRRISSLSSANAQGWVSVRMAAVGIRHLDASRLSIEYDSVHRMRWKSRKLSRSDMPGELWRLTYDLSSRRQTSLVLAYGTYHRAVFALRLESHPAP